MRISDWSSDVCSSDLTRTGGRPSRTSNPLIRRLGRECVRHNRTHHGAYRSNPKFDRPIRTAHGGIRTSDHGNRRIHRHRRAKRSEEHTSELQSLMRISYAVFCLKKKTTTHEIM